MTLKIMESYTRDVGRGVIRIDYATMDKLELSTGDCVEIAGKKRSVAKAMPLYPSDEGKNMIRGDGLIRGNLGVELGMQVGIKKIPSQSAVKITVREFERIPVEEKYLADALDGVFVTKGDIVMVPYFGGRPRYEVIDTEPSGAVLISSKTPFTIEEKEEVIPSPDAELRTFQIKYLKNSIDNAFKLMNLGKKGKIDYLESIIQLIKDKK